ncbi:MAG: ABC transporter ATP-binding protein [Acidimicrobiia bacterium]
MELELRGITKRFPGVLASDHVDLTVRSGEVLALLGENGAGKTTLMNILYGLYTADEGEILIDGEVQHFDGPGDAIAAGIGMVHQHFMLVPVFTVAENVVLGIEPTKVGGLIDVKEARREVREISEQYGLHVDPDAYIEDIPVGIQQRVEIIKVLFRSAEVLVFDEPTAVLTPQEVEEFFGIVNMLRDAGKAIIFITHKLKEVLTIADRIAVLRRGAIVGEALPSETDEQTLADLMVGRPVDLMVHKAPAAPADTVLSVHDLIVHDDLEHPTVNGVSFDVRAGEIVCIAGVQGNGQTELVEAITGLRDPAGGRIELVGSDVTEATPRDMHRWGTAHIPEDRQRSGLVTQFSVAENMVLDGYYAEPYSKGINMQWDEVYRRAAGLVIDYDVRTPSVHTPASGLSGGNQQKLIVAREFSRPIRLVVASQPTRGVDVGSIEYIHEQIIRIRDEGAALLIVSTELDEVLALADRILVMFRGRVVAETRPEDTSPAELGLAMAGVEVQS